MYQFAEAVNGSLSNYDHIIYDHNVSIDDRRAAVVARNRTAQSLMIADLANMHGNAVNGVVTTTATANYIVGLANIPGDYEYEQYAISARGNVSTRPKAVKFVDVWRRENVCNRRLTARGRLVIDMVTAFTVNMSNAINANCNNAQSIDNSPDWIEFMRRHDMQGSSFSAGKRQMSKILYNATGLDIVFNASDLKYVLNGLEKNIFAWKSGDKNVYNAGYKCSKEEIILQSIFEAAFNRIKRLGYAIYNTTNSMSVPKSYEKESSKPVRLSLELKEKEEEKEEEEKEEEEEEK